MKNNIIKRGAEAVIIKKKDTIIKNRLTKSYRLPVLDIKIRKTRTKKEFKILKKASTIIPAPKVFSEDLTEMKIEMEFIAGKVLSESLDSLSNNLEICKTIGEQIAFLHDKEIIHGDLTTSNMIYNEDKKLVYFIDFGLSYISDKTEDKAVDLHLIKQALEARHFTYFEKFFFAVLKGYSKSQNAKSVLKRLEAVEKRGRYKQQI